ncbi:MAG: glucosamine--fructose-6-phosphate aminotransferase (isomerizing) [Verrucomicrobiales bacterium]
MHNSVIENYHAIGDRLEANGHEFKSETDSEMLAHLMGKYYDESPLAHSPQRLVQAVRAALAEVKGTYGIAVMHLDVPDLIVGARLGSPLVIGLGEGEHFISSDVGAMVAHTWDAVYLNDYDLVMLEAERFEVLSLDGAAAEFEISQVDFTQDDADKGDYPHYMLKEIFEQPESLKNAMRGRLCLEDGTAKLGGLVMTPQELREMDRIVLSGCGTASHAAMIGEYLIEGMSRIPVEVEIASEFRYRNMPTSRNTLFFVLSQSGETIDTLAAMREGQRKGHRVLGICNNVASTISRESDGGVYMPCVFIAPDDTVFAKNVSNMEEVKARKVPVFTVTTEGKTEGKTELERIADDVVYIPDCADYLTPILASIPLQLFSYHLAVARGCDVDKPRNLAKSVTVE